MRKRSIIVSFIGLLLVIIILFSLSFKNFSLTGKAIYENQPGPENGTDIYIRDDFPDNNFGTGERMGIGMTAGGTELRGFLYFNVSSIPQENSITEATITVHLNETSNGNFTGVNVYQVTANWIEEEATWNDRTSSEPWNNPGGDYDSELISSFTLENQTTFYNFSITEAVRDWANGTYENYGIILIANSSTTNGNYKYIDSSDSPNSTKRPKITVKHSENSPPEITNISHDSSQNNPKEVGEDVTFEVEWNDFEDDDVKILVCNSSNIDVSGCQDKTFCNISYTQESPVSCSYTTEYENNKTTSFWIGACDSNNCSVTDESYFYVNHKPNITIIQPNGGEEINQSDGGNYTIKFNVSDPDSDSLIGDLYYNEGSPGTSYIIKENLNLSLFCSDTDTSKEINCSYSWNTSGIYGEDFYLTGIINDSFSEMNDSSDSNFSIYSVLDPDAPKINDIWFDSEIYSGKEIEISSNVTDNNLDIVWATINTTPQTNITLSNISQDIYSGNWTAQEVGSYELIVNAKDIVRNTNSSSPEILQVEKPNASALNTTAPEKALPYHTIKVSAELNSTDSLRDVYAYLHAPEGFDFMEDYPQNNYIGNFSENELNKSAWYVSTPLEEGTYTLNTTFTDGYSNQWETSSTEIHVTSSAGDYDLNLEGYSEVVGGDDYYAEATFDNSGNYYDPDSIEISLYDAAGNLIIDSISMTRERTGKYNYTYTVPSTAVEGQWETIVNATKDSESYYANNFWKVVGGPFDLRNIQAIDSSIEELEVSVETENTGDLNKDLFLEWNLTREDTGEPLDSGMDTFMVPANSNKTWTVYPTTSYLGDVRITFMGFYSDGERVGAYEIFDTTEENETTEEDEEEEEPSTDSGGSRTSIEQEPEKNLIPDFEFIDYQKIIFLTSDFEKEVLLKINNSGNKTLTNLNLNLEGLDTSFYTVSPEKIKSLEPNNIGTFEIIFNVEDFKGERDFFYNITSNEISEKQISKINVLSVKDYFIKEIERLREWISDLMNKANDENQEKLKECGRIINKTETYLFKEDYINANEQLKDAEKCIRNAEEKIKQQKEKIEFPKIGLGESFFLIITWILILILISIGIFIAYQLNKKLDLIDYFNKKEKTIPTEKRTQPKKDIFYKKLEDIKKKLGKKKKEE